jgi:hypothetical protein
LILKQQHTIKYTHIWKIDVERVLRALYWLKQNNVRYHNIQIHPNIKSVFDNWMNYNTQEESENNEESETVESQELEESILLFHIY